MKSSVITILIFILGVVVGRLLPFVVSDVAGSVSHIVLCALLLSVGIAIGSDRKVLASLRHTNPRLALLPVVSVGGALGGSVLASMLLGRHSLAEWLAVGSGMGYYSVSSVIISGMKCAELATLALMANIVREVLALLATPWLATHLGRLAPIAAAGATAMDTTLPVISATCGQRYVPLAIYCGMATDFSVPLLVTLFCSL